MHIHSSVFDSFIYNYSTQHERSEAENVHVVEVEYDLEHIQARVEEDKLYITSINYTPKKVTNAFCSCSYEKAGYCRHIIATLQKVDQLMLNEEPEVAEEIAFQLVKEKAGFTIENCQLLDMDALDLRPISADLPTQSKWETKLDLREAEMGSNFLAAKIAKGYQDDWMVRVNQGEKHLNLVCSCYNPTKKLCTHLHFALKEILRDETLQLPFNQFQRHKLLTEHATKMGLNAVENPDDLFDLSYSFNRLHIEPKYTMLSLSESEKQQLKKQLLPEFIFPKALESEWKEFLVVEESSYSKQLFFTLYKAPTTKNGDLKAPFEKVNLLDKMRLTREQDRLLFYAALMQQDAYQEQTQLYGDILKNPEQFPIYFHHGGWDSKKITPKNIELSHIEIGNVQAQIHVKQSGDFFVLIGELKVENQWFSTRNVQLVGAFFQNGNRLTYIQNETVLQVLRFFKQKHHEVFVHQSHFANFREEFLEPLENNVAVHYSFVKKAPAKLIKERSLNKIAEYLIYLSESQDFVLITPVIMYGETEVNVLSKRTVLTENPDGTLFSVDRNYEVEQLFLQDIQQSHPNFEELPQAPFFFLHKNTFLDGDWFLDAFEHWRKKGYAILGFNQLRTNKLNANKMKVQMTVKSGIDWFDTDIRVNFGKQEVSLKEIQKAVTNKSRYVELGDGTQGILPEQWMRKFSAFFRNGEIAGELLRTHKSNFQIIDQLFEDQLLSEEIQSEIRILRDKLHAFNEIKAVAVPKSLKATLRDYQKEGLNWLNFLDEFGFGGVLADDMGLGKTVQMIAYMLLQLEKGRTEPNLVVLPTSLLFNWQRELEKFAPSLKFIVLHGANRPTLATDYSEYNVVITTYGTMLSDIEFLRKIKFNLIILDESQAIKNPSSKRYKAAKLLKGRQKMAVTGTPIENNTFDLYAQLSFTMPGLLGSAKRFSDDYAIPIDKFQDTWRAKELQQKIHPFILRRTKDQVAQELPEKTEMVIYCEMDTEQQRVYDLYKLEFQKYLAGLDSDELHSGSLHVLQGLTKLRQICNSPALLSDEEFYGDQSAKLDELLSQIEQLKAQHKMVVFSQFVGMLELIKARLDAANIQYAYLTGQTKDREQQVQDFQEKDEVRVFLISLKAGGVGLNLTKAEYVFLVDPWWNPAVENQAIDRAHRIGQKNKVVAVRLITPNTIEEKIMELQKRKRELSNELIHTDQSVLKQLSKEDLLSLL